ncbi:MAG: hypothetical protein ABI597_07530 [Gammaproteobacteria bacterium]
MSKYRLTKSILRNSTNLYVKQLRFGSSFTEETEAARDLNFVFEKSDEDNKITDKVRRLSHLTKDMGKSRGMKLNNKGYRDEDVPDFNLAILEKEFPTKVDLLLEYYSQKPTYLCGGSPYLVLVAPTGMLISTKVASPTMERESKIDNNVFYLRGEIYHKLKSPYLFLSGGDLDEPYKIECNNESVFRLTEKGFQLVEFNTESMAVRDMMMGVEPKDLDWFKKRDSANWNAAQKMGLYEPIFSDSPIFSLKDRLREAFHNIYNTNNSYRYGIASFFGWPSAGNSYNWAEYLLGGFIITPVKNIIKGIFEFIPAIIEVLGGFVFDQSRRFLSQPQSNAGETVAANIGLVVGGFFHFAAKATRLLTMRLTSPIRSFKEAWQQNKVLGVLSAVVSVAAFVAAAIFVAPLAALVAAKSASVPVLSNIVSGIKAAIGWVSQISFLNSAGAATAAVVDLGIAGAATAATVALAFSPLVAIRAGIKKLFGYLTGEKVIEVAQVKVTPPAAKKSSIDNGKTAADIYKGLQQGDKQFNAADLEHNNNVVDDAQHQNGRSQNNGDDASEEVIAPISDLAQTDKPDSSGVRRTSKSN